MPRVESSVHVDKPIAAVFEYMIDPAHQVAWSPNFLSLDRVEPGPLDRGKRFTGTIKKFGTLDLVYSEFERPRRFTMATDHKMGHFTHAFTFETAGSGTRVAQEIVFAPKGFAKAVAPFMKGTLRKMASDLDREIKRTVEAL